MGATRRWFFSNHEGWNPTRYEWGFTRNPIDIRIRQREEQAVFAAVLAALSPHHSLLEVGPGTGNYTVPLARRCAQVVASDCSASMLDYLQGRLSSERVENVELQTASLPGRLAGANRFDVALSVGVLNYVRDLEACLRSLRHSLKAGGQAVFTVPLRSGEGRVYALTELLTRRRVWLRSGEETAQAAASAGLSVISTQAAGLTRKGLTFVVRAVANGHRGPGAQRPL